MPNIDFKKQDPVVASKCRNSCIYYAPQRFYYSDRTLVGQWYESREDRELRAQYLRDRYKCPNETSVYHQDYGKPNNVFKDFRARIDQRFRNRMRANYARVKQTDGPVFNDNMTTLNDICYRLKPQRARKQLCETGRIVTNKREADLARSLGNLTTTGLTLYKQRQIADEKFTINHTNYNTDFNPDVRALRKDVKLKKYGEKLIYRTYPL